VAGAGGVILFPRGNKVLSFHWSLGIASNNQAEAYALLQGLLLAKKMNIHSLSVIGDSKLIINHARKGTHPTNIYLNSISHRIYLASQSFHNLIYFHVFRHNNKDIDEQANLAIAKESGSLYVNNRLSLSPIP
jgi:ribonuclease HI